MKKPKKKAKRNNNKPTKIAEGTYIYTWTGKKKRNPTDLTLRNNRARNKDIARINQHLKAITLDIVQVFKRLDYVEYKMLGGKR